MKVAIFGGLTTRRKKMKTDELRHEIKNLEAKIVENLCFVIDVRGFHKAKTEYLMESKGGKKKPSSSSKSLFYEAPLRYTIEDIQTHRGFKKFRSLQTLSLTRV